MSKTLFNLGNVLAQPSVKSKLIASSLLVSLLGVTGTTVSAQQRTTPTPPATQSQPAGSTKATAQQLVGQWQTKDAISGDKVMFVFTPEGQLFMVFPPPPRSNIKSPVAIKMAYKIDTTTKPMQIDVITGADKAATIFDLTTDGKLRMELDGIRPGQARPAGFGPNALSFEKVSSATTLPENVQVFDPENPPKETPKAPQTPQKPNGEAK